MTLYRWQITWSADGWNDKKMDVVAPDAGEALRLAYGQPHDWSKEYRPGWTISGATRYETIVAVWLPVIQGPRPATVEEEAAAEVEALIA